MDYEKKYKDAIQRAKHALDCDRNNLVSTDVPLIYSMFPELKESEDKRVRNQIINFIEEYGNPIHCEWQKDWIVWLEKQGETYTKKDVDNAYLEGMAFAKDELEKQGKQKSQRMISAEAKEAMYDKSADKVEPKCEESKTKIFDAPTPFEDKLYVFVAACEFLAIPSKIEFILEHSQEILDAAREQIGKEQKPAWSEEDEKMVDNILTPLATRYPFDIYQPMYDWLKSLKDRVQPKQEWTKEDDVRLQACIDCLQAESLMGKVDTVMTKWLESLKQRIIGG